MSRRVPILMYHQVAPQASPDFRKYTVSPRALALQMSYLSLARYNPVSMDEVIASHRNGPPLPPRPVAITFDDGYQGCIDHAVPVLRSFGFRATFFIVAGLVGHTSRWLFEERRLQVQLFDWQAACQLEHEGHRCEAHSMTHPHLTDLSLDECRYELLESRRVIEGHLGRSVRHFAYPYGAHSDVVCELAQEAGYISACSVRIGLSAPSDDPLALRRVPVTGYDTLLDFICKLRTGRTVRSVLRSRLHSGVRRASGRGAKGAGR